MAARPPLTCGCTSRWYGICAFSYLHEAATFSAIPRWFFSLPASYACQQKRHLNSISQVSAAHLKISLSGWPSHRWQYLRGDGQHSSPLTNSLYSVPVQSLLSACNFSFLHSLSICLRVFQDLLTISLFFELRESCVIFLF